MSENQSAVEYALGQLKNDGLGKSVENQLGSLVKTLLAEQTAPAEIAEDKMPDFACELVAQLDKDNPERMRHTGETEWEFYAYLGRRKLIGELKAKYSGEGE